jgi:hypothetical protein
MLSSHAPHMPDLTVLLLASRRLGTVTLHIGTARFHPIPRFLHAAPHKRRTPSSPVSCTSTSPV